MNRQLKDAIDKLNTDNKCVEAELNFLTGQNQGDGTVNAAYSYMPAAESGKQLSDYVAESSKTDRIFMAGKDNEWKKDRACCVIM